MTWSYPSYSGHTGALESALQLAIAAILWNGDAKRPLYNHLPWKQFAQLVVHGLQLPLMQNQAVRLDPGVNDVMWSQDANNLALTLLVTMAGCFLKIAEIDANQYFHILDYILPMVSALFERHFADALLGGVAVILMAITRGHCEVRPKVLPLVPESQVHTGKTCAVSMQCQHAQLRPPQQCHVRLQVALHGCTDCTNAFVYLL